MLARKRGAVRRNVEHQVAELRDCVSLTAVVDDMQTSQTTCVYRVADSELRWSFLASGCSWGRVWQCYTHAQADAFHQRIRVNGLGQVHAAFETETGKCACAKAFALRFSLHLEMIALNPCISWGLSARASKRSLHGCSFR